MKPRIKLAETKNPEGSHLALMKHDGTYSLSFDGQELMHSDACASEKLLGSLGVAGLRKDRPARVLIGGLGLGYTLRTVMDAAGPATTVEVVEIFKDVIEWNHQHLRELNGSLLTDPRVEVYEEDVVRTIQKAKGGTYDVILLDIDNGPVALVAKKNRSLYSYIGVRAVRAALKKGGRAVFWSAGPDLKFEEQLRKAGFQVNGVPAKVHERAKRAAYTLYVADKTN